MNYQEALSALPNTDKKVVITHSGGLDSSTAVIVASEKYGPENVISVGFNYGQKQSIELERATELCDRLGVSRHVLDLGILGDIVRSVSANISGTDVEMPTIKDILGNPQPPTYVPFRNLIMLSLTMSVAEVAKASHVFTGLQVHDEYGYWDTSQRFVDSLNAVAVQNRTHKVEIIAPFSELSKRQEIDLAYEMGKEELLSSTITCYNPQDGKSCGICPSCAERIMNFVRAGYKDPIEYVDSFSWEYAVSKYEVT